MRRIQNQRKEAGFDIADKIEVFYEASPQLVEVFNTFGNYIATETLSVSVQKAKPPKEAYAADFQIDGMQLKIGLVRKQDTDL